MLAFCNPETESQYVHKRKVLCYGGYVISFILMCHSFFWQLTPVGSTVFVLHGLAYDPDVEGNIGSYGLAVSLLLLKFFSNWHICG